MHTDRCPPLLRCVLPLPLPAAHHSSLTLCWTALASAACLSPEASSDHPSQKKQQGRHQDLALPGARPASCGAVCCAGAAATTAQQQPQQSPARCPAPLAPQPQLPGLVASPMLLHRCWCYCFPPTTQLCSPQEVFFEGTATTQCARTGAWRSCGAVQCAAANKQHNVFSSPVSERLRCSSCTDNTPAATVHSSAQPPNRTACDTHNGNASSEGGVGHLLRNDVGAEVSDSQHVPVEAALWKMGRDDSRSSMVG